MAEAQEKKKLDWERFTVFVDEFRAESDRAAVILGAAKIDLLLFQILQARLVPITTGKDELLDGDSPLATFSARINAAYRFGLIDAPSARSLHMIRRIRNAFAHEIHGCTLKSGAHADRVKELVLPLKHLPFFSVFRERFFPKEEGPSIDFRTALAVFVGRLEYLLLNTEPISQQAAFGLINPAWERMTREELLGQKAAAQQGVPADGTRPAGEPRR